MLGDERGGQLFLMRQLRMHVQVTTQRHQRRPPLRNVRLQIVVVVCHGWSLATWSPPARNVVIEHNRAQQGNAAVPPCRRTGAPWDAIITESRRQWSPHGARERDHDKEATTTHAATPAAGDHVAA